MSLGVLLYIFEMGMAVLCTPAASGILVLDRDSYGRSRFYDFFVRRGTSALHQG